jgi:hypothetical protein
MTTLLSDDLIFYKKDGLIMSGGYSVESHMLQNGISPMKTFNKSQNGGKDDDKVSHNFDNLVVPAGLYFITQKKNTNEPYKEQAHYIKEHKPIADDVFDKLFEMVQYNDKQRRKTKKHTTKIANKKTKRNR